MFCADHEAVFRLLEEVKGPVSVQRYFIHHAIKEAARWELSSNTHRPFMLLSSDSTEDACMQWLYE